MQQDDKILFTEGFQALYECLGVLGYMYTRGGGRGFSRQTLTYRTQVRNMDSRSVLARLEKGGIIYEREGLLHLDRTRFYSMSVWDLLVIAEPWLADADPPPGIGQDRQQFISFCRHQNLSRSYMH